MLYGFMEGVPQYYFCQILGKTSPCGMHQLLFVLAPQMLIPGSVLLTLAHQFLIE